MAQRRDYIYDELLYFLGTPLFQVPVITFMEQQCLIFEPTEENVEEYKKVHSAYKELVTQLLEAFKKDIGLTEDEIIKALADMNSKADLKEIFQAIFEQVLAMEDYTIFVRIMIKKNIELQEQALAMLMQKQGVLPHSLTDTKDDPPPPSQQNLYGPQSEEEILQAVLEQSKREYEEEQARQRASSASKQMVQDQQSMANFAKVEQAYLENTKKSETEKLDKELRKLSMESVSSGPKAVEPASSQTKPVSQTDLKSAPSLVVVPTPAPVMPASAQSPKTTPTPTPAPAKASVTAAIATQNLPSINKNQPKISSAEAAANWMKQANEETIKSDAHSAAVNARAAEMAKLNPEELMKRQQFLKEQRDKLLEMKKKEREKTLLNAEKNQPKRPSSARVAKAALGNGDGDGGAKLSPEEEKKLAMRKAIADRLKAEMLGNK